MELKVYQDFSQRYMIQYGTKSQEAKMFIVSMEMLKVDEVKKILGDSRPTINYACIDSGELLNIKVNLGIMLKRVYG